MGADGQRESVKHSAEKNDRKRPKMTKNDQKRPKNVFTASLLRPYRLLTDFAIHSDTSNFPPIKVQKDAWNIGHGEGFANGEHEGHEDKNTHENGL